MARLGLALSGGGFRATLYHLGVVRYLKDSGQLQNVTDIASVSGGSILAAHLVINWDRYTGDDDRFDEAASELIKFVQFDVRNFVVRRMPLQYSLRLLAKLTRRQGRNLTPNAVLERCYKKHLLGDKCLYELPENPLLHILATNVSNGGLSVFNRNGLYIQQRPKGDEVNFEYVKTRMASIPRVVGASSAFPGLFPPVEINAADLGVREGDFPTEYFTDGGVFDNLGIRAFSWLKQQGSEFDQIIVSDAGKPFQILSDTSLGFIGQSVRATDILWDRVWQLERENFGKRTGFLFLPITATVEPADGPDLHPAIQEEVQTIRTDLDSFSDQEVNALAQHGYEVARNVHRTQHSGSEALPTSDVPWAPIAEKRLPGPNTASSGSFDAAPATVIARKLRHSSSRRVWSTLINFGDWTSYVYLALALLILGYLPFQIYRLYDRSQLLARVNQAIAQGDPDIRRVLDMVTTDPTKGWVGESVEEVPTRKTLDYSGIEMMTHSRIIDLRRWDPAEDLESRRGKVYVSDRVEIKLMESYQGDRTLTIFFPAAVSDIEFRQPSGGRRATIRKVSEPVEEFGLARTLYEFDYDLEGVAIGEPVTLEMEMLLDVPKDRSRAQFTTRLKTDLVSMWLFFPEDRPYRTYNLVKYAGDRTEAPEVLESRYKIDHPYGSLIGWSVVNPTIGNIYECRWTYE